MKKPGYVTYTPVDSVAGPLFSPDQGKSVLGTERNIAPGPAESANPQLHVALACRYYDA